MSFSFFILGVIALPNVVWWGWADRRLRHRPRVRLLFALFMAPLLLQVLWIAFLPSARDMHRWLPEWWMILSYLWHLLVLPAVLVLYPLGGLAWWVARRKREAPDADPARRGFLAACAVWGPPVAAGGAFLASLPDLHDFRLRKLAVAVRGLPRALDGLRIAHVSDLHYGKYTTPALVDRLVDMVNGLEADLVLMTGDLIDLSLADLPAALETVARLDRREGLFLCEGNHDLIDDGPEFERRVRAAEVPLLLDEAATVRVRGERIQLVGARWRGGDAGRKESMARCRALRDPAAFPILLAHHPHMFDEAEGFPVTLSGHTHGGQLMLNERLGAGPVMFRYWSGLYRRAGRSLVVSNGVGNWFPLRTHAPAEVVQVTLRRAVE
jgi:predicted MPP superfamily phosphohydrolase